MYDTRDVIHRTEKCLECHLGTKNKFVDHEMIAAGHPDLYFELDSFSAVMPRHWKSPRESEPGKPVEDAAWVGIARVERGPGGAVACRDGAINLAREERALRQKRRLAGIFRAFLLCMPPCAGAGERPVGGRSMDTSGVVPGDPAWNSSRYAVFRLLAKQN